MKRRAAAIDIGTNSVLLTIAERGGDDSLTPLLERATITRLGAGVDRTRELDAEACARTLACLAEYRDAIGAHAVEQLDVVGTSALRDARGGAHFSEQARVLLGVAPRVLSGTEEAELSFVGATLGLEVSGPRTVFDVGGGSTEIVVGEAAPESAISLDVGSVRLFERHVRSDPARVEELVAIDRDLEAALVRAPTPRGALIGVAGTVTTLSALEQRLSTYDSSTVHGARLARHDVEKLAHELSRSSLAERRALPGMEAGRADVIVVGARIVRAVMRWANASELVVSDRGVRWGLLARALGPIG